jgi:acetyltransferase-like isoleucine patch superfamily enzyme
MFLLKKISNYIHRYKQYGLKKKFGFCGTGVVIHFDTIYKPEHIFMYDNTNIFEGFTFISDKGHFTMKKGSGAAQGLTVITDYHIREAGHLLKDKELFYNRKGNVAKDVVVEEDVWIGANVTILPGVTIKRGVTIGAGSVVRSNVPPYSVVLGNPAKVIGFNFSPEEIIEHEKKFYDAKDRLSSEELEKNYNKYYISRINEIKHYLKV